MKQMRGDLQRDRERTSGRILKAASVLFLERGYAAVSLSQIAGEAQVTKSLLHHYFGDKRGLWKAVKDDAVASYAKQQRSVFTTPPADQEDGVSASIAAYFSFLRSHPEIARLFALESLDGEFEPGDIEMELQAKGIAFLEDLQRSTSLRKDIQPDMVLAVFSALTEHWFISRQRVAKLNNLKENKALDNRYFDAVTKILGDGLRQS